MTQHRAPSFGTVLVLGVFLVGGTVAVKTILEAGASNLASKVDVANATPTVSAVVLNNGNAINLTTNATTSVLVNFTVVEQNGCNDVYASGSIAAVVRRSGVTGGNDCIASTLDCYRLSTTTQNSCVANATTTVATTTFEIYYFADATDASSSFPNQDWVAYVQVTDGSNATSAATSTHRELNTQTGINVTTSSLDYGILSANTNTGATNQQATLQNTGNSSTSLNLSGTALTSGSNVIATTSQHYATSTFTYGGNEQALQETAQTVSGFIAPRPPLTVWATTTKLSNLGISTHQSVAYNNFLYVIGGLQPGSTPTATVSYAPINATGSIGAWATTTPLSAPKADFFAAAHNGFMYAVAGKDAGSSATATTLYAPINATGSLGAWTATAGVGTDLTLHSGFLYNSFIYVTGGESYNFGAPTSTVLYAPINANGTLGSWATTTPFSTAVEGHSSAAYNGFAYTLGGDPAGALTRTSTVLYAPINANGTLGSWATTNPLKAANLSLSSVAYGNILYTTGGTAPLSTSSVSFAPINLSGSAGTWSDTVPLAASTDAHSATAYNGFLYVTGGNSPSATTTSYAPLATRSTYWGLSVPGGTASGSYAGTNTFSSLFQP